MIVRYDRRARADRRRVCDVLEKRDPSWSVRGSGRRLVNTALSNDDFFALYLEIDVMRDKREDDDIYITSTNHRAFRDVFGIYIRY